MECVGVCADDAREECNERLQQVPEAIRGDVIRHLKTVWAIRKFHNKKAKSVKPLEKVKWMADLSRNPNLSDSAVRVGVYLCDCENDKQGAQPGHCMDSAGHKSIEAVDSVRDKCACRRRVHQGFAEGKRQRNRTEYELTKGAK